MPFTAEANLPPINESYEGREYWRHATSSSREEFSVDVDKGKHTKTLMLGCGISALGKVLYDAGWHSIVNVDWVW
ncbi:uncharacterized protein L203_106452 [Cryptococcus depauperatus CBS 7841]|uniref:Methyltransferase type 11 domain-containing protein n=1 Tax=Cryptococcus depauperatus CBS 7841 TaxID=1295531 RepID=A0AAJ8M3G0_9TREE